MIYNKDTDKEIKELYSSYDLAYGDILVSGLGFGILALWLCSKPNVKSVTVVEISSDVIDLFKQSNSIPNNLNIINDNMVKYNTNKFYDCIFLDHYETQDFDWRLEDISKISSRIKHDYIWAWSLEEMFIHKVYEKSEEKNKLIFYKNIMRDDRLIFDEWIVFINKYLPQESSLSTISKEKIKYYIINYFNILI
jgi:hypothetical protein